MIPRRALVSLRQRVTTTATSVTRNPSCSLNPSSIPSSISQNQRRLPLRFLFSCSSSPHFISPAITNRSFVNGGSIVRNLATRSMNDSSNRPPKETILLDGCDFEHWLVVMEPPDPNLTRDDIIDSYIKTLAQVVGSEDDARMKIYSVSTKHYFAFGALVSEELSYKIKELPRVRWVLPDSYLDVKNKSYGGEPFIDGQAVPYDPKYHEEWVRNNARANERSRRNDRPRNYDRSRRRENMMNRDMPPPPPPPLSSPSPISGQQMQNQAPPSGMPNQSMPPPAQNQDYMNNGMPMQNQEIQNRPPPFSMPNRDMPPPPNQGFVNRGMPPPPSPSSSMQNQGFQGNYGPPPPMQNQGFQNNYGPPPTIQNRDMPNPMGNQGYQNPNMPPPSQNLNYQSRQMPPPTQNQDFQNRGMPPPTQNQDFQNRGMPPPNQNWNYQGRDVPPPPMPNRDFQNRDVPPPMQNRDFPNRDMGNLPNRDYQSRDMNIGNPPGSNFHYRETPDNMHAGNVQNRDHQGWGGQGNMSTGGAPTRDHQSRDVPEGEYTNVTNRNF